MQKNLLAYVVIGLLSSTFYFVSKELIGDGFGWIGITIGLLLSIVLVKKFEFTSQRMQLLSTVVIAAICGIVFFGAVWYNKRNTAKDLLTIQGVWEAKDSKNKYLMEVEEDSTYMSLGSLSARPSYIMFLSEDSLILKHSPSNTIAFRLYKLTDDILEVGIGDSKLIFHKKNR